MKPLHGIFLLRHEAQSSIYGPAERQAIADLVTINAPPLSAAELPQHPEALAAADVIFGGWGMPSIDAAFLARAPRLLAIFYGAGSARGFITDALWERGIRVTSANAVNAIPVAEYALATIILSLKQSWQLASQTRNERRFASRHDVIGSYHAIVGLISLGLVGRLVRERLRALDVQVIAYDPYITPEAAAELDVTLLPLETIFDTADVISLHTPLLPETVGLIGGALIERMHPGATLLNTARGAIIRETELIAVLQQRPDLQAVLDVTNPEPPDPESLLYTLPNVVLTPHIAGSLGNERRRLGQAMVAELRRYIAGEPLRWEVSRDQVDHLAMP